MILLYIAGRTLFTFFIFSFAGGFFWGGRQAALMQKIGLYTPSCDAINYQEMLWTNYILVVIHQPSFFLSLFFPLTQLIPRQVQYPISHVASNYWDKLLGLPTKEVAIGLEFGPLIFEAF